MKKAKTSEKDEMQNEYDFSGKTGVCGKYYEAYRRGQTVRIHNAIRQATTQHFTLEGGAVMIEPDVRKFFPNSESVNKAPRSLISLIPDKPSKRGGRPSNRLR